MNIKDMPTNEFWDEYEYQVIFGLAGEYYPPPTAEYANKNGKAEVPSPEDVKAVLWMGATSPEGYASVDFTGIFALNDGQYAMCWAGCDTTGWDCRGSVYWKIGPTLESVYNEIPEYDREDVPPVGDLQE